LLITIKKRINNRLFGLQNRDIDRGKEKHVGRAFGKLAHKKSERYSHCVKNSQFILTYKTWSSGPGQSSLAMPESVENSLIKSLKFEVWSA
jgi:hypothetical protein